MSGVNGYNVFKQVSMLLSMEDTSRMCRTQQAFTKFCKYNSVYWAEKAKFKYGVNLDKFIRDFLQKDFGDATQAEVQKEYLTAYEIVEITFDVPHGENWSGVTWNDVDIRDTTYIWYRLSRWENSTSREVFFDMLKYGGAPAKTYHLIKSWKNASVARIQDAMERGDYIWSKYIAIYGPYRWNRKDRKPLTREQHKRFLTILTGDLSEFR